MKTTVRERGIYILKRRGFPLCLFAALLFFFLLAGRDGPVLFDDSESYMRLTWHEGVMPLYPLFLLGNECLFGKARYLGVVVIEQAFLASTSIVLFEETIRRRFSLHCAEGVLLSVLMLYPYTIEMPMAVMTQAILTEGVAYSLFYLLFLTLLRAVWDKSYGRLAEAFVMTLLLSAVRSQMQVLFGVCGVVFYYLLCSRRGVLHGKKGKGGKWLYLSVGLAGCMAIALSGILLASGIVRCYRIVMQEEHPFYRYVLQMQAPEEYQRLLEARRARAESDVEETEVEEGLLYAETAEAELVNRGFPSSQYMTLIFSRGMYEADYEDAALFSDPVLRGLYLSLYEAVDAEKQRYVYAQKGLWMWKDIVGGIGKIGKICIMVPSEYYVESAQEIIRAADFGAIRTGHMQTIGVTLIKAHFGRFLYHTLSMLPQAFISTIFFQYAPLYLLCHLITAFLYLAAAAMMIWGYRDERVKNDGAEMMALVLGTNLIMVLAISLVFFGQQRYLVYAFGPFYIAFWLLLRQFWCVRLRSFLQKKFLPRKRGVN